MQSLGRFLWRKFVRFSAKVDRSFMRLMRKIGRHKMATLLWLLGAYFFFMGVLFLWAATLRLPDLTSLSEIKVDQSVKIYDRTGNTLLYDLSGDNIKRTVVPLTQISPNIQDAVISIEDPTFNTNNGVVFSAILRAVWVDILSGSKSQGGSTITQQVIKNTVLTNDKSLARKLKEWILALKLNRALSKQQILELYLNQIPFGGTMYGVEEASQTFFGVPASGDDLAQSAYLAAMLSAPSYYSPYGNHKDTLDALKNVVLDKMQQQGYITADQDAQAKAEAVTFLPQTTTSIQAPHFVFYVEQYLENKYGEDAVQTDGWKVITTLDANLQQEAEADVSKWAAVNQTKFNASNEGLVALDPTNGQILAMVGSRNYFTTTTDGAFNVTLAPRQPGSAFKPIVYAQAFTEGYTPNTILWDVPTQFSTACSAGDISNDTPPCYSPQNYDNEFRGPMTLRDAIAQSINVPSVKLLYLAGISQSIELAKSMGISTLGNPNQYGLTLVLGGGEVTLLDMTSAYGSFATNGVHYPYTPIMKIEDQSGNVVEDDTQPSGTQVLGPLPAEEINDVLSDPVARAPLGEAEYTTFPGYDVAVKTGTTNNYRDAWTIGYTPNLVVGVWAGNNDDTAMTHQVSGFIVGPMWNQFMNEALPTRENQAFVRTASSTSDESNLPPVMRGIWQQVGQDGMVHEILYWIDRFNPLGPQPTAPQEDPQYNNWDTALHIWLQSHPTFNTSIPGATSTASTTTIQTTQAPMIPVGPAQ